MTIFLRGSPHPANPEVASCFGKRGSHCPGTVLELMTLTDKNDTNGVCPAFLNA